MRQNLPAIDRTLLLTPRRILHNHGRQPGTPPVRFGLINHHGGRTPTPGPKPLRRLFLPFLKRTLVGNGIGPLFQPCQRTCQVLRMDFFIRWPFVPHLPAERRARRGADEEHFLALRGVEMLVGDLDGGGFAEVDAGAGGAHDGDVVEEGADCDGIVGGVEGGDDAAERSQGGEGMERGMVGDEGADLEEGGWVED